jgi:transcriptional regulator with XRE-family HTH domain
MDPKKTGLFIAAQRKEKRITQKDLADKLGVTDKAVSRWETGRGFPDVSLLPPLAEFLQISVSEIISGNKMDERSEIMEETVITALHYSNEYKEKILRLCAIIVSLSCLGALAIGAIINFATEGAFTWSQYMAVSVAFAWAIAVTALLKKKGRLPTTLFVASVLLIPYVYALERLSGTPWFFDLGLPIAVLVIAGIWVEYLVETKLTLRWPFLVAFEIFLNTVVYFPIIVALSLNFAGAPLNLLLLIVPIIGVVLSSVFLAVGFALKKT